MNHSFDVDIAKIVGVNAAIIFNDLCYWITKNKANKQHFHDDLYWTYNSIRAWKELYPYLTERQIRTALQKLVDSGLVVTGNYNRSAYDRTIWYSVTAAGMALFKHVDNQRIEPLSCINASEKDNTQIVFTDMSISSAKQTKESKGNCNVEKVVELYKNICVSFPKIRVISEKKHKAIVKLLATVRLSEIEDAFALAEHNCFLKGMINTQKPDSKYNTPFKANFDWLINEDNLAKILNGKYAAWDDRTYNLRGENNGQCAGGHGTTDSKKEIGVTIGGFEQEA